MNRNLETIRSEIDIVDDQLVELLNRRFRLSAEARILKANSGLTRVDQTREKAIYDKVLSRTDPAERDTMFGIYERIFNGARGTIETIARGVIIKDNKVLLCMAKGGSSSYLPGGHIEFGETGRAALEREVREELGVKSHAIDFLGVVENTFLQHGKPHAEINLVYRLELIDNYHVSPSSQEDWIEFKWCPLTEINNEKLLPIAMKEYCR